jgi:hypothetical protein
MRSDDRWYVIFDTLRDQSRRRVLVSLRDIDSRTVSDIVDEAQQRDGRDRRAVRIAFVHIHLPKLDETGYIDWRKDADRIDRGPRFGEIEPVIDSLERNSDRLPDGWL